MNRFSRLPLVLQPTHPDHFGGLGLLNGAQFSFGVIFAAVGTMLSSTLANLIIHTESKLSDVQLEIIGFVILSFAIITGPLCTFFTQLFRVKRRELGRYSTLAYQLSEDFHTKWIETTNRGQAKGLIDSADPSTVADYQPVYEAINRMRVVPLKRQRVVGLVLLLVAPFLPLIFTQISIKEALQRLAQALV